MTLEVNSYQSLSNKIELMINEMEVELNNVNTETDSESDSRLAKNGHVSYEYVNTLKDAKSVFDSLALHTIKNVYPLNLLSELGIYYSEIDDDTANAVNAILDYLTPEEKQLIKWRYEDGMTYKDIGRKIFMSGQTAANKISEALRKFRNRQVRNDVKNLLICGENQYSTYKTERDKKIAELNENLANEIKELNDKREKVRNKKALR